jgi:hypothetical protein
LALAAYIGNYKVAKVDVKGAYIQTEITGSPIYMKLDKRITSMALEILPSLQKLSRVMGYLKQSVDYEYIIQPIKPLRVIAYVDAAFAIHDDSKSHSGVALFVAGVLVYSASRKQTCVTKSPTESELVALSDYVEFIELFQEFVLFMVSEKLPTPIIHQDSTSVIMLVTRGGGVTRTRHLRNRMHLVKEAVDDKRLDILQNCRYDCRWFHQTTRGSGI